MTAAEAVLQVVGRRGRRHGGGALSALRGDRGRPVGLLDRGDLRERDQTRRARNRQVLQRLDGRRRVGDGQVDRERRLVDLDGADRAGLHRVVDECADRDLRQAELRGGILVDRDGDIREGCREVARDLADPVRIGHGVDDRGGRLLEGRLVGSRDIDLDVGRAEPAAAGGDRDLADVLEIGQRVLHVLADGDLVGVGIGGHRVGDAAAAAGERVPQGRSARADRGLHGLDAVDGQQRVLDLLGRGILRLQARRGTDLLRHREGVLPRVAEEVGLHERRHGDRADEHQHREAERDPGVLQGPVQDRDVRLLQARSAEPRGPPGRPRRRSRRAAACRA